MKIQIRFLVAVSALLVIPLLTQVGMAADASNRVPAGVTKLDQVRNPQWSRTVVASQALSFPKKFEPGSRSPASSAIGPLVVSREQRVVPISFQEAVSRQK